MRVLALLALAACSNVAVRVRPADLSVHAQEIVNTGEADVPFEGTTVHVKASERVEVRLADGDTQRLATLTIGELVQGCVPDPDSKQCLANQAVRDPFVVRREHHVRSGSLETGVAFGLMGGAVGTCLAVCQDRAELGEGLAYVGLGVAAFMGLFLLVVMAGGRD
ncbi:MAG TPA: hypothetical protein VMZ53_25505 [Kofleriaceae bacterium]|nr:hypothetical protein [Kofleriaceae bacterium]